MSQVNASGQQPVHMRNIAVEFGIYRWRHGYCSGAMLGGWFFLGRPTDQWMGVPAGNIGTGKVGNSMGSGEALPKKTNPL